MATNVRLVKHQAGSSNPRSQNPMDLSGVTDHRLKDADIVDHLVETAKRYGAEAVLETVE